MKKLSFLIIIIFLSNYCYGQLDFGLRGGVTTSKLYTNLSDYTSENILGYQAGVFARIYFGKHLFLQPEGYFVKKGGNLLNTDENKKYEVTLSSVDVPLLLGVKFLDLKITKITVYGGPVVSFVNQRTVKYFEDGIQIIPPDPQESLKTTNWGLQAGASLDVLILTLDIRHEWGITDMLNDPETELKSGVWLIGLGIRLF